MSTQHFASLSGTKLVGDHNQSGGETPVKPIVLRLDSVPPTGDNRGRIRERVRRLNNLLQESGIPFRLRLL